MGTLSLDKKIHFFEFSYQNSFKNHNKFTHFIAIHLSLHQRHKQRTCVLKIAIPGCVQGWIKVSFDAGWEYVVFLLENELPLVAGQAARQKLCPKVFNLNMAVLSKHDFSFRNIETLGKKKENSS